ncbi:MAG: dTDP-4-dehydrorhamnose reductase [Nitrospirota bacterium]
MRILIIGKDGQVGWELQTTLSPLGEVVAVGRDTIDLAHPDSICANIREIKPNLIVNAAAYTAVDRAEGEPDIAMAVNGTALSVIAGEAKRVNASVIHYSTDYVFDGKSSLPYTEDDLPNPLNIYGKSKQAGEVALVAAGVPYLIFRTSWVYGARGENFLLTILKLAGQKKELTIVDDQIGAPTSSRTIARATADAIIFASADQKTFSLAPVSGLYHLTAGGEVSWCGFAKEIVSRMNLPVVVTPIPASQYPTKAIRPVSSRLDCSKLKKVFGIVLPSWEDALGEVIGEMS